MKLFFRLCRFLLTALLCVLLALNLGLLASRFVFKQSPPQILGYAPLTVLTGSMQPSINVGDIVLVKVGAPFTVGDTITYRTGGTLVTHQLLAEDGDILTTKGTANNAQDTPFSRALVVGKVVGVIPGAGLFFDFLRTPLGLALIFILTFAFIQIEKLLKNPENNKNTQDA